MKTAEEALVHDTVKSVIQTIADIHGIQIRDAKIHWIDTSSTAGFSAMVRSIELDTVKRYV